MAAGNYFAQPMYSEAVSAVTATPSVQLGAVRLEAGEEYVYVYNAGNSQISIGKGAIMSAVSGYSVTVSSVSGFGAFIGFCKHVTMTTGTYGWLLTKGFVGVTAQGSSALVAGDVVVPGLDGSVTPQTGALTGLAAGLVVGATASAGAGTLFVKCFGA